MGKSKLMTMKGNTKRKKLTLVSAIVTDPDPPESNTTESVNCIIPENNNNIENNEWEVTVLSLLSVKIGRVTGEKQTKRR